MSPVSIDLTEEYALDYRRLRARVRELEVGGDRGAEAGSIVVEASSTEQLDELREAGRILETQLAEAGEREAKLTNQLEAHRNLLATRGIEIDRLKRQVESLKAEPAPVEAPAAAVVHPSPDLAEAEARIAQLKRDLQACRTRCEALELERIMALGN